jgi:uncharacterized protein YktB (UPF0637 family)
MEYVILTFPRCGSHYLQQLIYQKTGLFIRKTHHISEVDNRTVISIIRKPEDTFRSMATMKRHYSKDKNIGIGLPLKGYVEFYDYLIKNSEILINYDDLISSPDKVLSALAKQIGLTVNNMEYQDVLFDKPQYNYLVSSKTSDDYYNIDLSKFDMLDCNKAYNSAMLQIIPI